MILRMFWRFGLCILSVMVVMAMISASAAANIVVPSNLDRIQRSVSSDDLKPSACNGIDIDELITGSGTISGTTENDLILGSTGNDVISGEGGDDCILGGGGGDRLIGNGGYDVCLGGPGSDEIDATCEN